MPALTTEQIRTLVALMDQEAAATRGQISDADPVTSPRNTTEAVSNAAMAEDQARAAVNDTMLVFHRTQLADIDAARARLADGTYGMCLDCGNDIPFARLQAYPAAKRCVECQRKYELAHKS